MVTNILKADFNKLTYNNKNAPNSYGVNHFVTYDGGDPVFAVCDGTILQRPVFEIKVQNNIEKIKPQLKVKFSEEVMKKFNELYERVLFLIEKHGMMDPSMQLTKEQLREYFQDPYESETYSFKDKNTGEDVLVEHPRHVKFDFQYADEQKETLKTYDNQLFEDENKAQFVPDGLSDIQTFLTRNSQCRIIFKLNRIFVQKPKKKGPKFFANISHVPHLVRRTSSASNRKDEKLAFSDDEGDDDVKKENSEILNLQEPHWDDVDVVADPEDGF